jgi:phage tail-like protein
VLLMDVNGTRLHLVLGHADWERSIVPPVDPDVCFDARRNTLGLRPEPFVFPTRADAMRLTQSDRRGAAVDRFGNHFWIGPDRRRVLALGAGHKHPFEWWPVAVEPTPAPGSTFQPCRTEPSDPPELSGLAITHDQYLVVGALDLPAGDGRGAGLLVFDLASGGPPVARTWPPALGVRPVDLASLPGGGVAVLDVAVPATARPPRLWQLDRFFRVVDPNATPASQPETPGAFGPVEPTIEDRPVTVPTGSYDLHDARPESAAVLDVGHPVSVDALPDESVLVLDRFGPDGHLDVSRWRCGMRLAFGLRLDDPTDSVTAFACTQQGANARELLAGAVGHDLTTVPVEGGSALARLYVVDDRGDQAFEFVVDERGADLVTSYHPLRRFSGKALVRDGSSVRYDLDDRWYPVPTQPVERYSGDGEVVLAPETGTGSGFDGGAPGTVWHRLVIDGAIPPGTSVMVATRAADDLTVLEQQPWQPEPVPYRRGDGSEIPYHDYACAGEAAGVGSWELLFQRAVGQYLQVRVTLHGDGRRSPRLWALRVHYPRFGYLKEYLPDIYREDRDAASFLDRYLANVEGIYTTIEGRITNVQHALGPQTIDAEYLPWLAAWVGGVVEPDWEPDRTRLFVRFAAQLYSRRGTARGLLEAIRLATHPCPSEAIFEPSARSGPFDIRVVERFRTRSVPGVVFGDPNDLAGPRYSAAGARWELEDGASRLQARWREFLGLRYGGTGSALSSAVAAGWGTAVATVGVPPRFPVLTPAPVTAAADWNEFVRRELAVTYARVGSDDDLAVFRGFLAQRYRRIGDYRAAWNVAGPSGPHDFGAIGFPVQLPGDGAPLQDWIMFVSSVLPMARAAHRAIVLVPVQFDDSDEERAQRLGRVRRVVEVERPAHTLVDVQPYWAAFRVGEARVGMETIVGEGSRYVDLVLGAGRLAHVAIPGGTTWRLEDQLVVGRDRVRRAAESAATGGVR